MPVSRAIWGPFGVISVVVCLLLLICLNTCKTHYTLPHGPLKDERAAPAATLNGDMYIVAARFFAQEYAHALLHHASCADLVTVTQ